MTGMTGVQQQNRTEISITLLNSVEGIQLSVLRAQVCNNNCDGTHLIKFIPKTNKYKWK